MSTPQAQEHKRRNTGAGTQAQELPEKLLKSNKNVYCECNNAKNEENRENVSCRGSEDFTGSGG